MRAKHSRLVDPNPPVPCGYYATVTSARNRPGKADRGERRQKRIVTSRKMQRRAKGGVRFLSWRLFGVRRKSLKRIKLWKCPHSKTGQIRTHEAPPLLLGVQKAEKESSVASPRRNWSRGQRYSTVAE